MTTYVLQFEWPRSVQPEDAACRPLEAASFETAKLEAALTYALAEFTGTPPDAYRIEDDSRGVVYRYPETVPPDG